MLESLYQWLLLWFTSLTTILKILLRSKLGLLPIKIAGETAIILGNGPSINQTLKEHEAKLKQHLLICVNHFPDTPQFEELQPAHCVIVAKEYWIEDSSKATKERAQRLFGNIVSKTTWKMVLHLPHSAKKSQWLMQHLKHNTNVEIHFFNDTPVEGLPNWNRFFFKRGWGMPRPHNVLIPSLMIALNAGLKNIFIVGADHSWLEELTVNDKNEALLHQKHFYDEDSSKQDYMYKLGKRPRRLHEILEKFMLSFGAYFDIKDYATAIGASIWNATPKSYIDAFERKSLSDL